MLKFPISARFLQENWTLNNIQRINENGTLQLFVSAEHSQAVSLRTASSLEAAELNPETRLRPSLHAMKRRSNVNLAVN